MYLLYFYRRGKRKMSDKCNSEVDQSQHFDKSLLPDLIEELLVYKSSSEVTTVFFNDSDTGSIFRFGIVVNDYDEKIYKQPFNGLNIGDGFIDIYPDFPEKFMVIKGKTVLSFDEVYDLVNNHFNGKFEEFLDEVNKYDFREINRLVLDYNGNQYIPYGDVYGKVYGEKFKLVYTTFLTLFIIAYRMCKGKRLK